jgi:N-acetylneuraminic acid mutarotase
VSSYSTTITCTDPSGGTTVSGNTANISISNGETISCVFTNTLISTICTPDTWTQKADFGGLEREGGVGFSIGNKGYIGLGSGTDPKDFWEWDQATNTWTQKADFNFGYVNGAVGFSIGNKGYIGTGWNNGPQKLFFEYNPATNIWTQKANYGGGKRWDAVGFSIGNKGYLGLGVYLSLNSVAIVTNDFWEYNPATNVWTQKADFGGGIRGEATGFSIGNKGYVGTGNTQYPSFSGVGGMLKQDFWEYNPLTNIWTQKANFGGGIRGEATGFSIGNKGYVGMGWDIWENNSLKRDFWEYNPTTNIWTQKADFGGTARHEAVGFSIGNKGYVGTGGDSNYVTKDFWEYCP